MLHEAPATSFARLRPVQARSILIALGLFAVLAMAITCSPLKSDHRYHNMPGEGDLALYRAEAKRIAAGESYYSAIATELRARGYPMHDVFNWRMPLPVWLIGWLPARTAQALLCLASVAAFVLGFKVLEREAGTFALLIGVPLLFGALVACWIDPLYYLTELWAGVFITLSLCAYGVGRPWLGVSAGLAAQFLRELSGLYSLICLGMAVYRRRWAEAFVWLVGLTCYAFYVAYHIHVVRGMIRPDDLVQPGSWIQFGGLPFVIGTAHLNSVLLLYPQWLAALYLVLAMIGFAGWNSPSGLRFGLTTSGYIVAFSIVGHYYNQYWGALYAPLFCFGAARGATALYDLWRASGWRLRPAASQSVTAA